MLFDISNFNEYRENNCLEVKKASDKLPNSIWETYSSFANSYGGVIILGVSENEDESWYVTGVNDKNKIIKEFWDCLNNSYQVSSNILTDSNIETYTD